MFTKRELVYNPLTRKYEWLKPLELAEHSLHPVVREEAKKASEMQIGGSHYKDLPIQPSEYIRKNGLGWYEGNIVKYITRYKQKGEQEDIKKVIHYAQLILEEYDD